MFPGGFLDRAGARGEFVDCRDPRDDQLFTLIAADTRNQQQVSMAFDLDAAGVASTTTQVPIVEPLCRFPLGAVLVEDSFEFSSTCREYRRDVSDVVRRRAAVA